MTGSFPLASADKPRIDLHTHSKRSDGTDAPAELVGKAKAARLT